MTKKEALLADLAKEAANTKRILEAVPDGQWDYRPHEKSMTLGRLAGHLAELPGWAVSMLAGDFDFSAAGRDFQPFAATDKNSLLSRFESGSRELQAALQKADEKQLAAQWSMRRGSQVLFSAPRHEAIRGHAIHHVIHHRGQLTVYLRLLDAPVPSTYGPTADTGTFF